jgi:excisionase family DNA binding protein
MATIHSEVTGRAALEPLAVTPRQACILLSVGNTRLYQLINEGELETYLDGRARRITMDSIRRRIGRLLTGGSASGGPTQAEPQPRRRGRPRKADKAAAVP